MAATISGPRRTGEEGGGRWKETGVEIESDSRRRLGMRALSETPSSEDGVLGRETPRDDLVRSA